MREILFRGKRVDNGEWVEGIFSPYNWSVFFEREKKPQIIILSDNKSIDGLWCEVIPETVGQYTGLTDKNGKKIFNGDIVKHYHDKKSPESYSVGVIFYDEDHFRWKIIIENGIYCIGKDCVYEITGNIYDNPELIKEDEWI